MAKTSSALLGPHHITTSWTSARGRFEYKLQCSCGWFIGSDYIDPKLSQQFASECHRAHHKHVKREERRDA